MRAASGSPYRALFNLPTLPGVCTQVVHMGAGSSVCIVFIEVSLLPQLPQKPVFSFKCFALFAKGRDTDGETVYSDTDETIMTQHG